MLDREILEDARKKAMRILKAADETVKAQALEWEKKTRESMDELDAKYLKRRETTASEIISRLPIEKRRVMAQVIEQRLSAAVQAWYAGLERGYVISLLIKQLKRQLEECHEAFTGAGKAFYRCLGRAEAEQILGAVLPGRNFPLEENASEGGFAELVLESDTVRVCASIEKTVDFFLREKRAELIGALVGTQVLETSSIEGGGESC